jgi:integrase
MLPFALPRHVQAKPLKRGGVAFFYVVPTVYRKAGCTVPNQALGADYVVACGADGKGGRAVALNALFDEWRDTTRGLPITGPRAPIYGTVSWLFQEWRRSKGYSEKVSPRSRPDYERTMQLVENITTKAGDKIGDCKIKSITPLAADKLYDIVLHGPGGERPRQAEKAVALCRRAWRVVHRLYPNEFDHRVPNPWDGVTIKRRTKKKKPAVTRDEVYTFAWGCIERGRPEPAAVAVICFEFLQRPENVIVGALRWADYRNKEWPNAIKIAHYKTGATVWHPLDGDHGVKFYEEAEAVLAKLPRRGIPMILREVASEKTTAYKPYSIPGMQKLVQVMRKTIGLPSYFTLDACRHGGMTELEEAELTEGQGRALSGHRTAQAYRGYAKETFERALAATRKRHAHRLANAQSTNIQNGGGTGIQNDTADEREVDAK